MGAKHFFVLMEMLMSAFRVLVKNPIKESFDITFIENEKKLSKY